MTDLLDKYLIDIPYDPLKKRPEDMLEEAYVSFEVAKLLKEHGFNCATYKVWYEMLPLSIGGVINVGKRGLENFYHNETTERPSSYFNFKTEKPNYISGDIYSAPTLQMAMAWLRAKYYITINISGHGVDTGRERTNIFAYSVDVLEMRTFTGFNWGKVENTYEEAAEAALKFTLETVIQP